jgi:hypothetical protein
MMLIASIPQSAGIGRQINFGCGIVLCLLGAGLYQLHRRFMLREETERDKRNENSDNYAEMTGE